MTRILQAILDFNQPLDVALLDQVAQVFLTGAGAQVSKTKNKGLRPRLAAVLLPRTSIESY